MVGMFSEKDYELNFMGGFRKAVEYGPRIFTLTHRMEYGGGGGAVLLKDSLDRRGPGL